MLGDPGSGLGNTVLDHRRFIYNISPKNPNTSLFAEKIYKKYVVNTCNTNILK